MIELRLKSECLATGKVGDYQLSDNAMEQLRKALPGTKVYSEPPADSPYLYRSRDYFGVVRSVDGDELIIDAIEDRPGMPYFDMIFENCQGYECTSLESVRAIVVAEAAQ